MRGLLDVDVNQLVASTPFYQTREESEDGKTVLFNNGELAFECRSLPATVAFRLLVRYPTEVISWCYAGIAIKKKEVLNIVKAVSGGAAQPEFEETPKWESDDVVDLVWKLLVSKDCIRVASYDRIYEKNAYHTLSNAVKLKKFNDEDSDLIEVMTLSACVLRLSFDSFFLNYRGFLESNLAKSTDQNNAIGVVIPSTLLDLMKNYQTLMESGGLDVLKTAQERAKMKKKQTKTEQ